MSRKLAGPRAGVASDFADEQNRLVTICFEVVLVVTDILLVVTSKIPRPRLAVSSADETSLRPA